MKNVGSVGARAGSFFLFCFAVGEGQATAFNLHVGVALADPASECVLVVALTPDPLIVQTSTGRHGAGADMLRRMAQDETAMRQGYKPRMRKR